MLKTQRVLNIAMWLLVCTHMSFSSSAQEKFTDNLVVSGNYQLGFTVAEYSVVSYTVKSHIQSFDLSFHKEKTGKNFYEQVYGYPQMGLGLFYSTLGNNDIYGHVFAVTYFFRINLFSGKKLRIFNRMGMGLGYLTKKFDLEDNYLNVVIGTHLNIHYNFRLGASLDISDRISLNAGVSFDHYSNGNTGQPNIGLNYLTAYSGLNYRIGNKMERISNEIPAFERDYSFEFLLSVGAKTTRSFMSNYYAAFSSAFEFKYNFSRIVSLGAGVDLFYDTSVRPQLEDAGETVKATDNIQTGIHISPSIVYHKFRFTIQAGFYLGFTNQLHHKAMYNRGIIKYYINEKLSVRFSLKSHLHILDYPELGFGYKF